MENRTLFLFSKGVSHVGSRLFTFALNWYILARTGSGLSFSISLLVNYLPQITLSLFAGKLSDRTLHPNRVLVLCDIASAASCCLPLLFPGLGPIYAAIFLLSAISAVFNNVIDAHLIHLEGVDGPETLKRLASSAQIITSGVNIIAPSLGGVLIRMCSVRAFALMNAVSFLLSAFGELWLKYRPRRRECGENPPGAVRAGVSVRAEEAAHLFRGRQPGELLLQRRDQRGIAADRHNHAGDLLRRVRPDLQQRRGGVGTVRGVADEAPRRQPSPISLFADGADWGCMLALALAACLPYRGRWMVAALCAVMLAVGWLSVDVNIQSKTAIQLFVDPEYLGKVLGMSTSISFVLIPLSLVIAGGMSELWPSFLLPGLNGLLLIAGLVLLRLWERKEG